MKKTKSIVVIFLILGVSALWLNSNNWFRLKMAGFCYKKGYSKKAMNVYEKIYRKEEVSADMLLQKVFRLTPQEKYNLTLLLASYYAKNRNFAKETEYLKGLVELRPEEISNYIRLYREYMEKGDIVDAAWVVAEFAKENQDNFPLELPENLSWNYRLGLSYLDKNMWVKAEETFKTCLEDKENFADVYYHLGVIYENQGLLKEAAEKYEKTLDLIPTHIGTLTNLMNVYKIQRKDKEANNVMREIKELTPPNKLEVNFSDKIQLLGYDINMIDSERAKFEFWFKCLDKMDEDYLLRVFAYTEDINLLPPKRRYRGFRKFNKELEKETSSWQIGEVYHSEYINKIAPGIYSFRLSFKSRKKILKDILTGKNKVDLKYILVGTI